MLKRLCYSFAALVVLVGACQSDSTGFGGFRPVGLTLPVVPDSLGVARGDTGTVSLGTSEDPGSWYVCCEIPEEVVVLGADDAPYALNVWRPARDSLGILMVRIAVAPDAWRDTTTVQLSSDDGYQISSGSFFLTSASDADFKYPITEVDVCDKSDVDRAVELAISPDGARVYVQCASELIVELEPATQTVASVAKVSGTDLALSPDGAFAYVTRGDNDGGEIIVIDLATRAVAGSIWLGPFAYPYELALTPDGTRAYVTIRSPVNHVAVVDLITRTMIDTIRVFDSLSYVDDVAVSPNGASVYVTGFAQSNPPHVLVIDVGTNAVSDTIPVSGTSVAFAPDGSVALVTGFGSIWTIDATTNAVVDSIMGGLSATPRDFAISSNGAFAAMLEGTDLLIFDLAEQTLADRVSVLLGGGDVVVSPDGAYAYTSGSRLTIVDLARAPALQQ